MSFAHPFPNHLSLSANPQLLLAAASLSSKPPGPGIESSVSFASLPSAVTSASANAAAEMSAETLRFLSAGHPSLPPQVGFAPRFEVGAAFPGLAAMEQYRAMAPGMPPPFGLYPGTGTPDLKNAEALAAGAMPPQPVPGYFYDPAAMAGYPYPGPLDLNGARRKNATRETTAALKAWLYEHRKNPYPTKGEKIMLAIITKMTLTQVSTWFANARRRLKKENKMTWSPRNRPGEDDDIGAPDESGDRPSSSLSASSDLAIDGSTLLHEEGEHDSKLLSPSEDNNNDSVPTANGDQPKAEKRLASSAEPETPTKKPKIWSIADTVASSSSDSAHQDSQPKKADSSPYHFTFNPWQQQMAALAAAGKPPMLSPHGPMQFAAHPLAQMRPELFGARPAMLHLPQPLFGMNPVPVPPSSLSAVLPSIPTSARTFELKQPTVNNSLSPVSSGGDDRAKSSASTTDEKQ